MAKFDKIDKLGHHFLNQSSLHVKATEMFDTVKDSLMISKLMLFSFVCGLVEPYLKVFQSDRPMVPFIYSEVKSVIKSLLLLIVNLSLENPKLQLI